MKALKDEVPCLDEFVENLDECGRIKFESPRRLSEVGEGTIYLLVWGSLLGFGATKKRLYFVSESENKMSQASLLVSLQSSLELV